MNRWDQLRAVALAQTVSSPVEYQIRRIARWYSKTYHTPLKDALEVPIEDLVLCYYESQFEDLTPERLEEEVRDLFTPEHEKLTKLDEATERKVSDDEFLKELQKEAEKKPVVSEEMASKVEKMAESMQGLAQAFDMVKDKAAEIPREISLNFKPEVPKFEDLPDDEPGTAFGLKLKPRPKKPKKP